MVRLLLFFIVALSPALFSVSINLPAKITVSIPAAYQNEEIKGEIDITRLAWQQIDESSFSIENRMLKVTRLGDVYPAGKGTLDKDTLVVSKYQFVMPGKPPGLYLFPAVSVKVGDNTVTSAPISFEVIGPQVSDELRLDARVVEKGPFYPGQKVTFQYLISFRNPIQLTREKLPLLEFPGFRTVGAPKIENVPQGASTVQIISQTAVAQEPGTYHSGDSMIEGYVYGEDATGNKVRSQGLIRAQAPDIEVTVLPFPTEGMPASFNGAIGVFHWRVRAVGNTNVAVGEKIPIEVTVIGSGDLDTVIMPDLSKQKGFKDVFRLSDLAPVGEIKENSKRFIVELRPLVSDVKAIGSIEFSSFDPISKTYVVKRSDPIAISVRAGGRSVKAEVPDAPPAVWPIEIHGNVMLKQSDVRARHMQDLLLVYAALFLTAAVGAQAMFRKILQTKARSEESRDIILQAIKQKSDPDECCRLLRKALLLRLYEVGQTKELVALPEELSTEGLQGEIRSLLISIEQKRFLGLETQMEIKGIIDEASQLYYRLK